MCESSSRDLLIHALDQGQDLLHLVFASAEHQGVALTIGDNLHGDVAALRFRHVPEKVRKKVPDGRLGSKRSELDVRVVKCVRGLLEFEADPMIEGSS